MVEGAKTYCWNEQGYVPLIEMFFLAKCFLLQLEDDP